MTSIKFKVIGLTRPSFKAAGSRFKLAIFGFRDLPEWEADGLLIQLTSGVKHRRVYNRNHGNTRYFKTINMPRQSEGIQRAWYKFTEKHNENVGISLKL